MKRTACFFVACALGLTLAASAQTGNTKDRGIRNAEWTVTIAGAASFSPELRNTPNPVSFDTLIEYTLDRAGYVRLNIYDSKENLIEALVDEYQEAGRHSAIWNAVDRESGAFVCSLNYGNSRYIRGITVLK